MPPKTEQFACFARTFTVDLELVHRCRLQKQNDGAVVGNLTIQPYIVNHVYPLPPKLQNVGNFSLQ